jgi:hypothetical protein
MKMVKALTVVLFVFFTILLAGRAAAQTDDQRPRLRIVHASPEIQKVDIYLDERLYFRNIYFTYISDYVPINPGTPKLSSRLPGSDFATPPFFEHTFTYENNKDYTVVAAGRLLNNQRWTWLLEDRNDLPGEGTSLLRIVHAAFETPSAEFCVENVCHTLAFQENSGYFRLDPGTYVPKVHVNGTGVTYIEVPPLKLQDNSVHTIFLVGQIQSQEGLKLLYTLDAGMLPTHAPGPSKPAPGHAAPPDPSIVPPPAYPPVTGAFLSPELRAVAAIVAGIVVVVLGSLGFRLVRRRGLLRF